MEGKSVLIIDADPASRAYLARMLQQDKYTVLQAASGREGLIAAWRDLPNLILIDPALPDLSGEAVVSKLSTDPRTAGKPFIALSSDPDPQRKTTCLEAGFSEYLVKSGEATSVLLQIIQRALLGKRGLARTGGLLIVFLSAKGGTGTSSLTANIAMNITRLQPEARVAVLDLVLPIGSIARLVGYDGPLNLVSMADMQAGQTGPEYLGAALPQPDLWNFYLLAGAPDPESANVLKVQRIPDLLNGLREAYDYVIVDLGRSLSRISLPILESADLLTLIVSTDLSTVELTRTVWEYLKKRVNPHGVFAILNRAVGLEGMTKAEAEQILGLQIRLTVPYMGSNFTLANNQHQPLTHKFPNDSTVLILQQAAAQIVEQARRQRAD